MRGAKVIAKTTHARKARSSKCGTRQRVRNLVMISQSKLSIALHTCCGELYPKRRDQHESCAMNRNSGVVPIRRLDGRVLDDRRLHGHDHINRCRAVATNPRPLSSLLRFAVKRYLK